MALPCRSRAPYRANGKVSSARIILSVNQAWGCTVNSCRDRTLTCGTAQLPGCKVGSIVGTGGTIQGCHAAEEVTCVPADVDQAQGVKCTESNLAKSLWTAPATRDGLRNSGFLASCLLLTPEDKAGCLNFKSMKAQTCMFGCRDRQLPLQDHC